MSRYVDGFLMVVRHQVTDMKAINDMVSQLNFAGAKLIGFVYNDYTMEGNKHYSKYYKSYKRSDS